MKNVKYYVGVALISALALNSVGFRVNAEEEVYYEVEEEQEDLVFEDIENPDEEEALVPDEKENDNTVSGGDIPSGDVSGGDIPSGDVSGGDVSGGDVSDGDVPGEDDFIDDGNWNPDLDPDPSAGDVIPDYVLTEKERKGIKPKKKPDPEPGPEPEEIVEIPKMGASLLDYLQYGIYIGGVLVTLDASIDGLTKRKKQKR